MSKEYDVIIGMEIHIHSKTESKMFCGCATDYFGKEPNTHVCPVCLGLPGVLPIPNRMAVEKCVLLGIATNCDIENELRFDRKHYFYPDLPKGYQISQYDQPICSDGYLEVNGRRIDIERIHQEEDVAKSTHHTDGDEEYSLIDFNKSGMPLLEIVTRPMIHSGDEAKAFATKVRQIARYLDIADADMEKGQMRCEPNISVQKKGTWEYRDGEILPVGDAKLNPKVEIKNIGSLSAIEKSVEYEVRRLIEAIENGEEIIQQTRGWDPNKGETVFQRSKETAEDYRYFPEPDIPIIDIEDEDIERISRELTELPDVKIEKYTKEYGLSDYDAEVLTAEKDTAEYFEAIVGDGEIAKTASGLVTGVIFALSTELNKPISALGIDPKELRYLTEMVMEKKILQSKANDLINKAVKENTPLSKVIEELDTDMISDSSELQTIAQTVIDANENAVNDYKAGKENAITYLMGQVMRETKGNADPATAKDVLKKLLDK